MRCITLKWPTSGGRTQKQIMLSHSLRGTFSAVMGGKKKSGLSVRICGDAEKVLAEPRRLL